MKPNSSPNQKQKWLTTTLPSGGRINKCVKAVPSITKTDTKSARSQSLDAIDGNDEINSVNLKEGVSENNISTDKKRQNTIHKCETETTNNLNTKTDDNKSNTCLNRSEDSSIGSTTSLNNTSSILNQDDTKSSSTTSSAQYSMTDNSESEPKRTLLNKYVKKVKSLMKK